MEPIEWISDGDRAPRNHLARINRSKNMSRGPGEPRVEEKETRSSYSFSIRCASTPHLRRICTHPQLSTQASATFPLQDTLLRSDSVDRYSGTSSTAVARKNFESSPDSSRSVTPACIWLPSPEPQCYRSASPSQGSVVWAPTLLRRLYDPTDHSRYSCYFDTC